MSTVLSLSGKCLFVILVFSLSNVTIAFPSSVFFQIVQIEGGQMYPYSHENDNEVTQTVEMLPLGLSQSSVSVLEQLEDMWPDKIWQTKSLNNFKWIKITLYFNWVCVNKTMCLLLQLFPAPEENFLARRRALHWLNKHAKTALIAHFLYSKAWNFLWRFSRKGKPKCLSEILSDRM